MPRGGPGTGSTPADLAYRLLFQDALPSWLFSVRNGATTVWERWNSYSEADGFGPVGMNSFNHYAYGALMEWMYACTAGIPPDPDGPGEGGACVRGIGHAHDNNRTDADCLTSQECSSPSSPLQAKEFTWGEAVVVTRPVTPVPEPGPGLWQGLGPEPTADPVSPSALRIHDQK